MILSSDIPGFLLLPLSRDKGTMRCPAPVCPGTSRSMETLIHMYSKDITLLCYRHFFRKSTVCHSQQVAQRPFGLARLGLNWLSWESGRHGSSPERAKTNQSAGAKNFGSDHLEPVTNFLLKMQQRRATSWSFELKLGFWFGLGSVRLGKVQVF